MCRPSRSVKLGGSLDIPPLQIILTSECQALSWFQFLAPSFCLFCPFPWKKVLRQTTLKPTGLYVSATVGMCTLSPSKGMPKVRLLSSSPLARCMSMPGERNLCSMLYMFICYFCPCCQLVNLLAPLPQTPLCIELWHCLYQPTKASCVLVPLAGLSESPHRSDYLTSVATQDSLRERACS